MHHKRAAALSHRHWHTHRRECEGVPYVTVRFIHRWIISNYPPVYKADGNTGGAFAVLFTTITSCALSITHHEWCGSNLYSPLPSMHFNHNSLFTTSEHAFQPQFFTHHSLSNQKLFVTSLSMFHIIFMK